MILFSLTSFPTSNLLSPQNKIVTVNTYHLMPNSSRLDTLWFPTLFPQNMCFVLEFDLWRLQHCPSLAVPQHNHIIMKHRNAQLDFALILNSVCPYWCKGIYLCGSSGRVGYLVLKVAYSPVLHALLHHNNKADLHHGCRNVEKCLLYTFS